MYRYGNTLINCCCCCCCCLASNSLISLACNSSGNSFSFPDSPKGRHDRIISLFRLKLFALQYPILVSTAELTVPMMQPINIREDSAVFLSPITSPHLPRSQQYHSEYKLWFKVARRQRKKMYWFLQRRLCKITEIIRYFVIMAVKCCIDKGFGLKTN